MKKPQIILVWSLLFGVALISVCSGMQGTLLGIRASLEDFAVDTIGLIMSAYYVGFLLGARVVPRWVKQVGHIRVFAALASIASVAILLHSAVIHPVMWFLFRMLTGFCLSGLFMVSESWLNAITGNDNRGRLLAAYMFTITLGFTGGQFLINLASPLGFELFILASVVLSIAIVPMLLSNISAPAIAYVEHLELSRLIRLTPLGAMGVFVQGLTSGAVMWFNRGIRQTEWFFRCRKRLAGRHPDVRRIGVIAAGRQVVRSPGNAVIPCCYCQSWLPAQVCSCHLPRLGNLWLLAGLLFVVGGVVLCFYSVSLSHINDHVRNEQILSASGCIIFINGVGGIAGPILSTQVMKFFGPGSLYYFVALVYLFMALFTLYRMSVRAPITAEEQSHGMTVMMQTSQVIVAEAMDETDLGDPLAPEKEQST